MPGKRVRKKQQTKKKTPAKSQNARRTIGLLVDNTWDPIAWDVWTGVHDVAQERDVNLICIPGGALRSPIGFDAQANVLYDLVNAKNVDGLVVWGGGLGQFVDPEEVRTLCKRYHPIPIVNVALLLEGTPSVLVDNYRGMREAVTHLIEVHDYRRIAFIRGPEGHTEADDRYRAYADVLAEHDIPLDPDLVAPGEFTRVSGMEATKLLLDKRKRRPQVNLEAIIAVDDTTAIGAMNTLQARGIRVPDDVAVVGFDNVEISRHATPPLTTVSSLVYDQARRGTEMVLALMDGEEVPKQVSVTTRLIVRQSCGCLDPAVAQAAAEPTTAAYETFKAALTAQREKIIFEMAQAMETAAAGRDLELAEQLANAFAAELEGESPGVFVPTLNKILRQVVATGGSVTAWQGILSTLRRNALPYLANDDEALLHAENLWQQARVMIGGEAERARAYQAFQAQQQANVLHEVGQALATSTTIAELADAMTRELPRLGIPSCYFSLYEDPGSPIESSRLILAYDKDERFELEAGGQRFPSYELTPDGAFRRENRYSVSLAPLYFGENQLGFALLEIGPQDARIHEPLRRQISGALQRALLIQQVKNHALQLQTAAEVSRAASSILDPDELIQQVVDLVRERFELYYAGLFLVDETKEWAVLQAGTGKAGQKMVRGGHKLQVGGDSMIGQCVATDQARIALDVGEEAVRFENPSLPQTRSELALPLISRGEAIGALTIQSAQEAAFSQEDITVLQTMADQLANAIQNARLFEETKSRLVQLTALQETTKAVASTLEPDKLLNLITQQATILLQSDGCMINLVDWEKKEDEVVAASGSQAHTLGFRTPLEGCLSGWVTLHNQPVISNQLQDDSRAALRWRSGEEQTQSAAIAPLAVKDQVIGTLVAMDKQGGKGEFDQADLDLLMTFAGQAAIAIQNARLFEQTQAALAETEDQARRLALLSELSEQLSRAADFDEIVNVSTAKVSQIFAADRVSVAMLSATGDSFDIFALRGAAGATPVGTRMEAKGTEMELAVRERRLVIRGNDPREDLGHIRSFMVAPLIAGREAIGTLNVASQGADTYTQSDGTLLLQTAALISAAIENSRLFKQTQDALEEVEATHRRYLERVWTEYLKTTKVTGYETERPGTVPLGDTVWPEIQQATEQQSATVSTGDGAEGKAYSALVAPVTLRGAAIGALGIHDEDGERQWSNDEIALIQTIADRMAVAAENLRLIEETQRRAARDRLTGEVTARMRETLDMETMLKTIVQEVRQTLGVPEVVVRLGTSSPLPRTTGDGHNRDKPGRPDGKERTA